MILPAGSSRQASAGARRGGRATMNIGVRPRGAAGKIYPTRAKLGAKDVAAAADVAAFTPLAPARSEIDAPREGASDRGGLSRDGRRTDCV
jgi:hypothetical protein